MTTHTFVLGDLTFTLVDDPHLCPGWMTSPSPWVDDPHLHPGWTTLTFVLVDDLTFTLVNDLTFVLGDLAERSSQVTTSPTFTS